MSKDFRGAIRHWIPQLRLGHFTYTFPLIL